jgi:digeranylgeranylglycerophospholipid reductase
VLAQVVGGIPISNVLPRMVSDGYMAVGDAAHQSDPLTAGGITNGMHGGLFAAQTAVNAIRAGDTSARFLSAYEKVWDAQFGALYRRLLRIREALFAVPEHKLDDMIAHAAQLDTTHLSVLDIVKLVVKAHPQLLLAMLPYFVSETLSSH